MEKRAFERVPSFIDAKVFYDENSYGVLILNLSQNGIYFVANAYLPSRLNVEVSIPLETTELKVPCEIVRMSKVGTLYSRFGAKLLSPSQEYIKFINGHKASM